MEERFVDVQKDAQEKEELLVCLNDDIKLVDDNSLEYTESKHKISLGIKPGQLLTSDVEQSHSDERCIQKSFLQSCSGIDLSIPKHVRFVSLNEKHLRHYLDLVEVRSSDSLCIARSPEVPCNISVNSRSSKMEILFNSLEPFENGKNRSDLGSFVIECPLAAGRTDVLITPVGQCIVGAIAENNTTGNILKSPLFCNLGALDSDVNSARETSMDVKGTKCHDSMRSPSGQETKSSQKLSKETVPLGNQRYGSEAVHKRLVSISSTSSMCSDHSSASTTVCQGMIHCIWKSGTPYFVFSVDDQNEVYVANLRKGSSSDDKSVSYMDLFHSRTSGKMEHTTCDNGLDLVGKMKISSSFTLCSKNSKIRETEFVLFGVRENHVDEKQSSTHILRKNKRLPKKVVDVFRTKHVPKRNSTAKFGRPSTISESFSWEPCQDMFNKIDELNGANHLDGHLPPNLELAAIVVKDHIHDSCQEKAVGGWGLKFLEKVQMEFSNTSLEASISAGSFQESCLRNKSNCSTSINVLVPAGFHGGPRTRNGGPSSLTERWRSGGSCDCGGWDVGCPLTVLSNKSNKEVLPQADAQGECQSYDLFIQGSELGVPYVKMANIHDDLYIIHFQSTLSAIQSFSIGMAVIHTQNPTLFQKCTEVEAARM